MSSRAEMPSTVQGLIPLFLPEAPHAFLEARAMFVRLLAPSRDLTRFVPHCVQGLIS